MRVERKMYKKFNYYVICKVTYNIQAHLVPMHKKHFRFYVRQLEKNNNWSYTTNGFWIIL